MINQIIEMNSNIFIDLDLNQDSLAVENTINVINKFKKITDKKSII